mmetsp:Transcript_1536/g.4559  ORF Transcript_1536/g.4559 Transcript_1536/m.4559 type:complete len:165 (-) Transcript_1536:419-913(-)|eukprot:CAMPEP_0206141348 /NCGR_PEP_ID=MMETSP1473-20131121/12632_1 /ASSEMBLY_ACC=CAM_ASM_001109 /TAXON_ID=1461547 /ORGANISM="Stichococcus sp, Strain RCC1054" /LENGTH=164 /DNA_ID=CAMNT_0053535879 /DNA_START=106 /DNA_END=600 /DNA_ORIENTATION=+
MAPKKGGAVDKPKKVKAKKDPNAPKKPSGAYIWFCNDRRPAIKADHPEWGIGEIGKELGNIWKTLSDSDKKPFVKKAEEDKERYVKADAAYKKSGGGGEVAAKPKKAAAKKAAPAKKEKAAPKKAPAKKAAKEESEDDDDDDDDEAEDIDEDEADDDDDDDDDE